MKNIFIIIVVIFSIVPLLLNAEENNKDWMRYYDCRQKCGSIVIDGVADEFAWQIAPEVGEFTRFQSDGQVVKCRTTAKILWDDKNLYILVVVEPDSR